MSVAHPNVYLYDMGHGLQIVHASDPANLQSIYSENSGGGGGFNGGLYATSNEVVDIASPDNPRRLGGYVASTEWGTTTWDGYQLQVVGDYLYVAAGDEGLRIFEIQKPAFIRSALTNGVLELSWNDLARGMTLEKTSGILNANWQEVPGSKATNTTRLPTTDAAALFRLRE
jgi:hypothetical protein